MKIVHVCLAGPYNDGWTYQDNLLPKYHKKLGYDVTVITTPFVNDTRRAGCLFDKTGEYWNEYGIKIIRLSQRISNKSKIILKLRTYKNLYTTLEREQPDIIFVHCCQFLDISKVIKYVKNHQQVRMYIDNHADFSNSAQGWFSYHIMHRILWKYGAQKAIPYTSKFYGVLPARVDFLADMYDIPREKIELLVMGADDDVVSQVSKEENKKKLRKKYHVTTEDFVISTGGKIDRAKWQVLNLLKAAREIDRVKLIVFGPIIDEMYDEVHSYIDGEKIQYFEWLDQEASYELFSISNLAVFPGRHSVYWEQVVGQGIPIMVKYWEGTTHVDLNGNCVFLKTDTVEELKEKIEDLVTNPEKYEKMCNVARTEGMKKFSYLEIAKKSIEMEA